MSPEKRLSLKSLKPLPLLCTELVNLQISKLGIIYKESWNSFLSDALKKICLSQHRNAHLRQIDQTVKTTFT